MVSLLSGEGDSIDVLWRWLWDFHKGANPRIRRVGGNAGDHGGISTGVHTSGSTGNQQYGGKIGLKREKIKQQNNINF
jgi:hypothetical protein